MAERMMKKLTQANPTESPTRMMKKLTQANPTESPTRVRDPKEQMTAKERARNAAKTRIVKSGGMYREGEKIDRKAVADRQAKRERDDRRRGFDKAWSEW